MKRPAPALDLLEDQRPVGATEPEAVRHHRLEAGIVDALAGDRIVAHAGIEVKTGVDGTIFMLLYGAPESDETMGIGGFLTISPDGVVSDVEPIRDPSSRSDPGSPAHLGVTPGTSTPWLMMVDEDGVRIYTRG